MAAEHRRSAARQEIMAGSVTQQVHQIFRHYGVPCLLRGAAALIRRGPTALNWRTYWDDLWTVIMSVNPGAGKGTHDHDDCATGW